MKKSEPLTKKPQELNRSFLENFRYTMSHNPYHDKLGEFKKFVLLNEEGEAHRGHWSSEVFKNTAPLCVEIGSGYGDFMHQYTQLNPDINFIAIEHRFKRSFSLARKLEALPVQNFRYLRAKGERLHMTFGEGEIQKLFFFFPDPWPKNKHHKKRLFQSYFLGMAYQCLAPDGIFYIKTDHDNYFEWMLEHLEHYNQHNPDKKFKIELKSFDLRQEYPEHFLSSFKTKFEKIFIEQGVKIKALVLTKEHRG